MGEEPEAPVPPEQPQVPDLATYDASHLKASLAGVRQSLAAETVLWHVARRIGGIPNVHPNAVAKTVRSLIAQEAVLLELLEGPLPMVRPEQADAAGPGPGDVIPIDSASGLLVPGAPSPEEVRRILQPSEP